MRGNKCVRTVSQDAPTLRMGAPRVHRVDGCVKHGESTCHQLANTHQYGSLTCDMPVHNINDIHEVQVTYMIYRLPNTSDKANYVGDNTYNTGDVTTAKGNHA